MTITGLPFVLENTMEAIMISHKIGNWSIFNEKSGGITIKLKFQSKGQGHGTTRIPEVAYRKKSPQQINRDRLRAKSRRQENQLESTPAAIETERKVFGSLEESRYELDRSIVQIEKSLSDCQSLVHHVSSIVNEPRDYNVNN